MTEYHCLILIWQSVCFTVLYSAQSVFISTIIYTAVVILCVHLHNSFFVWLKCYVSDKLSRSPDSML
jgi:hypothetical protein